VSLVFEATAMCVTYAVMVDVVDMLPVAPTRWLSESIFTVDGTGIMRKIQDGQICISVQSISQYRIRRIGFVLPCEEGWRQKATCY
jgi:hypothetical protein